MDHERVNISTSTMSCGVMELSRIGNDTRDVLYAIASRLYHPARGQPCAFIVWSDLKVSESSQLLKYDINGLKFGIITTSTAEENPRTGNAIVVHVWAVDHAVYKKWYKEQRVKRLSNVGT